MKQQISYFKISTSVLRAQQPLWAALTVGKYYIVSWDTLSPSSHKEIPKSRRSACGLKQIQWHIFRVTPLGSQQLCVPALRPVQIWPYFQIWPLFTFQNSSLLKSGTDATIIYEIMHIRRCVASQVTAYITVSVLSMVMHFLLTIAHDWEWLQLWV